jgi:hypothetical protein
MVQRSGRYTKYLLKNYFKEDKVEGVQFWRHSGFWSPDNQELVYTDDEVHLNEVYGYTKYYNSVRVAVVCLLK